MKKSNFSLVLFAFGLFFLFVTSCSEYNKVVKSTDNELKKTKALEYYEKGDYIFFTNEI